MFERVGREQTERVSAVRGEWLDRFFSFKLDEVRAVRLVDFLYRGAYCVSRDSRPRKIFVNSPFAIMNYCKFDRLDPIPRIAAAIRRYVDSTMRSQLSNYIHQYTHNRFWSMIELGVKKQVEQFVESKAAPGISKSQILPHVLASVKGQIFRKLPSHISNHLYGVNLISSGIGTLPLSHLRNGVLQQAFWDARRKSWRPPEIQYFCEHGDFTDFEWVCIYDSFYRASGPKDVSISRYVDLVKANIFLWLPTRDFAVISRPPVDIKLDDRRRFHCLDGPALRFADGYEQFWVRGVNFSPDLFDYFFRSKSFTGFDVLDLRNNEQRAVVILHFGFDKFIKEFHDRKCIRGVDADECVSRVTGEPVRCELYDVLLEDGLMRFLVVEDHTTHKKVTLGVPIDHSTETCRGAVAWTFGMTEEEYFPDVET